MELVTGRSTKDSGRGGGGSDSGRYSSSSRSEREKAEAGGGRDRDYSRSGGGRSDGGGRRGEKQPQSRRKGSSDSRGGSGSSRHYSDSRQDKGYRYSSHRDRGSRWESSLYSRAGAFVFHMGLAHYVQKTRPPPVTPFFGSFARFERGSPPVHSKEGNGSIRTTNTGWIEVVCSIEISAPVGACLRS